MCIVFKSLLVFTRLYIKYIFFAHKLSFWPRGNSMLQWIWFRYYYLNRLQNKQALFNECKTNFFCVYFIFFRWKWLVRMVCQQWKIAIVQVFFIIWTVDLCSDQMWCSPISSKAQKVCSLLSLSQCGLYQSKSVFYQPVYDI